MSGSFLTAAGYGEAEYIDKKSRFIGHVQPVSSENEAKSFIERIRGENADAAHNVWAYTLRAGSILRWSDDGEPGGTSGQPTLNAIRGAGLEDTVCVTTRYFGGILLGSGGLVRAYSNAARMALEAAGVQRMCPWRLGSFECSYAQYDKLCRFLTDRGARVENSAFGAGVELIFSAPDGLAEGLCRQLTDISAGSVSPRLGEIVLRGEKADGI